MESSNKKEIQIEILKRIRKMNRDDEIRLHGKQISFRHLISRNKKRYNRKNLKKISLED